MSWLSDLLQAYGEGEALKRWGPGWREKLDQLRATTANLGYEGQRTQAQTRLYDTQGQAAAGELGADNATREYFAKSGKTQAVAKFLEDQATAQATRDTAGASAAKTRAETAALPSAADAVAARKADLGLTSAHTGYFNRMPHDTGSSSSEEVLINNRPAHRIRGTQMFVDSETGRLIRPLTPAQEGEQAQLDEALSQAKTLERIYNSGGLTQGAIKGRLSKGLKNAPLIGDMVASDKDISTDRMSGAAMLSRLYAMTGKQINATEITRLEALLPDRSQSPKVAANNARMFRQELERIQNRWQQKMLGGGMMTGEQAPLTSGPGSELDSFFRSQK